MFPGPWITPHTTRYGSIDTVSPDAYISAYQGDTWDDARNGTGTTTVGPTQTTAPANHPAPAAALSFDVFPLFVRYHAAQAFAWHSLPDVDPAVAFPPYVDAPPAPDLTVVAVEYEAAHGTMLPAPRIEVAAATGGGNLNLSTALMDIYQIPGALLGDTPTWLFINGAALASWSSYRIGSVDSVSGGLFVGPAADPTHTVIIAVASAAQPVSPFPYSTAGGTGFQQFPDIGVLVEYVGPRFRFVYDAKPPLRQFPRDDVLGGAPRQATDARSVQGSARQGWVSAYR